MTVVAPEVSAVYLRTRRTELRYECFLVVAIAPLVAKREQAGDVGVSIRVHCNPAAVVCAVASDLARIRDGRTCRIDLLNERVRVAESGVGGTDDVGVARGINGDAVPSIVPFATGIGGIGEDGVDG